MIRATNLEELYEEIRTDVSFAHLRRGKNRLVPGEGNDVDPMVMLIGEAPGATEAMELRPFVGKSGVMLRRLMQLGGLYAKDRVGSRSNCWLTNVVKYRPPRNRTPDWREIKDARPYLRAEWELIGKPEIIVCVGAVAMRALWPKGLIGGMLDRGGSPIINYQSNRTPETIAVWPMIHPSFALREENESYRPIIEQHWNNLGTWLANYP